MKAAVIACVALPLLASSCFAADWPSPYGPQGNSIVPEELPRTDFKSEPPKVVWRQPLYYRGYGAPVIDNGKIYIIDRDPLTIPYGKHPNDPNKGESQPGRKTHLRCFSLDTGAELWKQSWVDEGCSEYDSIKSWPTFDAKRIFLMDDGGTPRCPPRGASNLLGLFH